MIFWNKTEIESKKKRSLRVVVIFSIDNVKIESDEREVKGKKKIKSASNQILFSYMGHPETKRTSRRIKWHDEIIFTPQQSDTRATRRRWSGWCVDGCTTSVNNFSYFSKCQKTTSPHNQIAIDKKTIIKWQIHLHKDALRIFISKVTESLHCSKQSKKPRMLLRIVKLS